MADLIHEQIEAAAKVLAACMDYPWEHMPEEGRKNMRTNAMKVIEAALAPGAADTKHLDWLEAKINAEGEIHLHDGKHPRGIGLGLRPGLMSRTLREAIDTAADTSETAPEGAA